jgi:hypothetical protein
VIDASQVKQLVFPFGPIGSAWDQEFGMRHDRGLTVTAPRTGRTFRIQFVPVRIYLPLELSGIVKGLVIQSPFLQGAMAPLDTAIAFGSVPRNQAMLET